MASSSNPNQRNSAQPKRPREKQSSPFDESPLWNHVKVIYTPPSGGNRTWTCNYCMKRVNGSYTKVKAHLLSFKKVGVEGCPELSDQAKEIISREHEEAGARRKKREEEAQRRKEYVTLPSGCDLKQPKRKRGTVEASFNYALRDEVDKECAHMMYASALPFYLVKNPYFRKFLLKLSNSNIPGYVPPNYNRLRTTLLEQEKAHVDTLLQPFRNSWKKKGVSLCSDGWGDRRKRPLISVMGTSGGKTMFTKSFDTSGNIKDSEYVASLFIPVIEKEGPENIVQIITNNAANFKAAGLIIEGKFANIFWTPCVVHSLNLALKSICEPAANSSHFDACKWISSFLSECNEIIDFVNHHSKALSIFQKYSRHMLLKVCETRFASNVITGERLLLVKSALEKMVMDPNWKTFMRTNLESKADYVKECIISDRWWDKLEYFMSFTSPMYDMIRRADCDAPCLHLIYDMWDSMIEEVKEKIFKEEGEDLSTGHSSFFNVVQQVLEARWNKSNTPLHCMAHSLVPKFYSDFWLERGIGTIPRIAPNQDHEVSVNRDKCFKKLFPKPEDLKRVYVEYGMFSGGLGFFSEPHVMEARVHEDPLSWWASYGASTPMLQALANKLLSQPASSSCCERNWSDFSQIQSVKRNKLDSRRTEDLVYIHNNLRLLTHKTDEYKKGPSSYWDVGGDSLGVEVDLQAFANIIAEDPSVEEMLRDGGDGDGDGEHGDGEEDDAAVLE